MAKVPITKKELLSKDPELSNIDAIRQSNTMRTAIISSKLTCDIRPSRKML